MILGHFLLKDMLACVVLDLLVCVCVWGGGGGHKSLFWLINVSGLNITRKIKI